MSGPSSGPGPPRDHEPIDDSFTAHLFTFLRPSPRQLSRATLFPPAQHEVFNITSVTCVSRFLFPVASAFNILFCTASCVLAAPHRASLYRKVVHRRRYRAAHPTGDQCTYYIHCSDTPGVEVVTTFTLTASRCIQHGPCARTEFQESVKAVK